MKTLLRKIKSLFFSMLSMRNIRHGKGCKCNNYCKFTTKTIIGNNCHFNGVKISGSGNVVIGNNFHSGKKIRMITTFHNYDNGEALPYDSTTYDRDIIIEDNVWLGESVMILGGVTIGEGAIIQAGSVVCKDVPALAIAGGHPAIPFKYRNRNHYEQLQGENRYR